MAEIDIRVDESNVRIDQFLVNKYPTLSRSKIQFLIKNNHITVNGSQIKPSLKLNGGEIIKGDIVEVFSDQLQPQKIELDIIYEDDDIVVINKPSGMVVHPGSGNHSNTLVNALIYHFESLSDKNNARPGIIHRLDKETSGVLIVAKNNYAHDYIASQFANRTVYKEYEAVVWGRIASKGMIEGLIGRDKNNRIKFSMVDVNGKSSKSEYFLKDFYNPVSHVKLIPYTGRTHQLRVHMHSIGHPIFGDTMYNGGSKNIKSFDLMFSSKLTMALKEINRVCLHARKINFKLPSTNEIVEFKVDLPCDMKSLLGIFNNV